VVLVLVRDLGLTGVPVVLERLLRARSHEGEVHVVSWLPGSLRPRIAELVSSCTVLEPDARRSVPDALSVGLSSVGADSLGRRVRQVSWTARLRHLPRPDVVLVHGAGAWPVTAVVPGDVPLVLHLHELEIGLDRCIAPSEQVAAFTRAARVLAVSRPVADLAVRRGALARRVELLPGVVEVSQVERAGSVADTARRVMGAGAPGWRKGTDRVSAIAHELARRGHPETVAWVGGAPTGADARWVDSPDPVRWLPATERPWRLMADATVVLVPSREDPLPLVALEAGLHGRAVVATPTGGLPELLGSGRGLVAPGHDLRWLAEATSRLLDRPDEAAELGAALRHHVVAHHDACIVADDWWATLHEVAAAPTEGRAAGLR
jgi:glycosyltransferase involved in cell wall biosynthesis